MYEKLTEPGDRLVGETIVAVFRRYTPLKPAKDIDEEGIERKRHTLIQDVVCVIEKPVRKN
jgi:hypothetical protein